MVLFYMLILTLKKMFIHSLHASCTLAVTVVCMSITEIISTVIFSVKILHAPIQSHYNTFEIIKKIKTYGFWSSDKKKVIKPIKVMKNTSNMKYAPRARNKELRVFWEANS